MGRFGRIDQPGFYKIYIIFHSEDLHALPEEKEVIIRKTNIINMPNQGNIYHFRLFLILVTIMSFSGIGCHKNEEPSVSDYLSEEDFAKKLKGDWYVQTVGGSGWHICLLEDSIKYVYDTFSYSETKYALNDPSLCTLPNMKKMGNWKFIEFDSSIRLIRKGICGDSANYSVEFSNLHQFSHDAGWWGSPYMNEYKADIFKIINGEAILGFKNFNIQFNPNDIPDMIYCEIYSEWKSTVDSYYYYILYHQ